MGRRKKTEPGYLRHKASRRGYSVINGHYYYWPGTHNSRESLAAYRLYCGQLLLHGSDAANATISGNQTGRDEKIIIATVIRQFLEYADKYYRDQNGKKTTTDARHRHTATTLLDLFAVFPVAEFGPKQIRLFLDTLMSEGLARVTINYRLGALKQIFKWASTNGIISPDDFNRVRDYPALPPGRFGLREPKDIPPVSAADFLATLPFMAEPYNLIVEINRLTGCRPSEILTIRPTDIDTTIEPWAWTIPHHKTSWRGHEKTLYLGPRCREILGPLLAGKEPNDLIFSLWQIRSERAQKRKQLAQEKARLTGGKIRDRSGRPSRGTKGRKPPGEEIQIWTYEAEIRKAAKAAGVKPWTPNQLRHLKATELRRQFGLEASQIALGHKRADVTQIYAERDAARLREIAEKTG